MKQSFLLLSIVAALATYVHAQKQIKPVMKGFNFNLTNEQCISSSERLQMEARIKQNIEQLKKTGKWPYQNIQVAAPVKLYWPLKAAANFTDSEFCAVTNFVDEDATSPGIKDWNCGARTYDGHTGTDISLWPFYWLMMDKKNVKIVAAADGVITDKHDGEYDRDCDAFGQPANYITLQHADGTQTIYFHCKKGTVTSKAIGATVIKGETLAYVGSSGNSTGPHLHFEVHDASNNVIDPYKGGCSTSLSLWKTQPAYYGRKMHKIMVSTLPSDFPFCPNPEQVNEKPSVPKGLNGYFYAFFSEVPMGDTMFLKILKPDNSVWQNFYYVYDQTYSIADALWALYIPLDQPTGVWKWQVKLNKKTTSYNFNVTDALAKPLENNNYSDDEPANLITSKTLPNIKTEALNIFPNPAKQNAQIKLSCKAGNYQLEIADTKGKIIIQRNIQTAGNNVLLNLKTEGIAGGVYHVKLFNTEINLQSSLLIE